MADHSEEYRREVAERVARNVPVIEEYRSTGGVLSGPFATMKVVLVHHTGAKSGVQRVSPVAYRDIGNGIAIFGANGGRDRHPDWYFNLAANPETIIELGAESLSTRARVATGDERAAIWDAQKADEPIFVEFEKTAHREIPVVIFDLPG
jgi:deazaflavin-dependent oxidoreductase (nitroreductase family)